MALKPCVECGRAVSDRAATCPHCGHPAPTVRQGKPCPECAKEIPHGARTCLNCGAPVDDEGAVASQSPPPPVAGEWQSLLPPTPATPPTLAAPATQPARGQRKRLVVISVLSGLVLASVAYAALHHHRRGGAGRQPAGGPSSGLPAPRPVSAVPSALTLGYLVNAMIPVCGGGTEAQIGEVGTLRFRDGRSTVSAESIDPPNPCQMEVWISHHVSGDLVASVPGAEMVIALTFSPSGPCAAQPFDVLLVLSGSDGGPVACLAGFQSSAHCEGLKLTDLAITDFTLVAKGSCWKEGEACCCPTGHGTNTYLVTGPGAGTLFEESCK